jgi:acyl-CoA dehydrogenase
MQDSINFTLAAQHYSEKYLEGANYFRGLALEIDENPSAIKNHLMNTTIRDLCTDRASTCLERTQLLEALSYGDAGVVLAAPGPSLAGLMIRELGNKEQSIHFYSYLKAHLCSTFLAVTEPNKGSDAANLETQLIQLNKNTYQLVGEKWLVGHGADADYGVVMAKKSQGPLGMCAVILTPEILKQAEIQRTHLNMIGLRGAQLSHLQFNRLIIPKDNILGQDLSPMKNGIMGMMKTFNRMRPGVAAFALGHAQALLDYAIEYGCDLLFDMSLRIAEFNAEIALTRSLLYSCASRVDQDPYENSHASLAKIKATRLSEKIAMAVFDAFGLNSILHHPLILKWYRDVFGFEYMEGTTAIQQKNITQAYLRRVRRK